MELQLMFTQTVTYKYYPSDEERDMIRKYMAEHNCSLQDAAYHFAFQNKLGLDRSKDVMYTYTPKDKFHANEFDYSYEEEDGFY